jgi:hypothetical protein
MSGKTETTDNSTSAIMFTLILYIMYFLYLKPVVNVDTLEDVTKYGEVIKSTYSTTAILFVLVVIIQIGFNAVGYQSKCDGGFMTNFGKVFGATFLPWFIIMGSVMISLLVFPGFKGAFSNVLGYYAVANSSNDILVSLLGSSDMNSQIDAIPDDGSSDKDKLPGDTSAKEQMAAAAGAIVKIVGNTSLLVNQITPSNFTEFWKTITPLIKPELQAPGHHRDLKEKLLENVVLKDNIGEACWYVYTTILLVTVVKSNIAELPCGTSVAAIHERMDEYTKKQEAIDATNKKRESVTYNS